MELQEKNNIKKTIQQNPTSFLYKYRTAREVDILQAFVPKQHLMVVWLNRVIIVLSQEFCYKKHGS